MNIDKQTKELLAMKKRLAKIAKQIEYNRQLQVIKELNDKNKPIGLVIEKDFDEYRDDALSKSI